MEGSGVESSSTPLQSVGWQSNKELGACILQLFESNMWTDVAFRCKDQNQEDSYDRINAHKVILAARSPVFQAMFFGSKKENMDEIYLEDIESHDLCEFLRSLYRDEVKVKSDDVTSESGEAEEGLDSGDKEIYQSDGQSSEDDSEDLVDMEETHDGAYKEVHGLLSIFKIAHKYQVQIIEDKCAQELSKKITAEYACLLLDVGLLYNNKILIESASEFVDKHAEAVLKSDGFIEMSKECLLHILKGDTFFVDEAKIFKRAMLWAEKKSGSTDGESIRNAMGDAFYYIRTPTMDVADFIRCTKRRGIYTLYETEDIIEVIEGVAQTTDHASLSNNHIKRIPLTFNLDYINGDVYLSYSPITLTTTIKCRPTRDVYLTGLRLNETVDGCIYSSRSYNNFNITGFPLKLVVSIEECCFTEEHRVIGRIDSNDIVLDNAALLKSNGNWYNIDVSLETLRNSSVKLKASSSYTLKGCDTWPIEVDVKTLSTNYVVRSIMFKTVSNRG